MSFSIISPLLTSDYDCRPSVRLVQYPLIGVVKNVSFVGGVLQFNIGPAKIDMFGLKKRPDWFCDGVEVKVDFENNTIENVIT